MPQSNSRYARTSTATHTQPDGRIVAYLKRRFLPQGRAMPLLAQVAPGPGERLDQFTNRTLGDPEQFWRVADANDSMDPGELVKDPAASVRVPVPEGSP